ncbi:MAG: DUF748 domain-containing protein [Polyangia bacterium]
MSEPPKKKKHWYGKVRWWLLIIVVVIVVAVRLLLDPIAAHYTKKALAKMDGFRGTFYSVHVSVARLAYNITQLKIIAEPVEKDKEPVAYAKSIDAHLRWRDLLRLRLVAQVKVTDAKSTVLIEPWKSKEEQAISAAKEKAKEKKIALHLDELLENLIPMRVSRLEIRNGQVLLVDARQRGTPELWVHDLQMTVENLATRKKLEHGLPMVVGLRGILQRSGKVELFLTAAPHAEKITFAGDVRVRDLKLSDLYKFIVAESGLKMPEGTFSLMMAFRCDEGKLSGSVKPILRDVKVRAEDKGLGTKIKSLVARAGLDIFSNRVGGDKTAATLIPIRGNVTDPHAQLWPTVLALVRNAFVVGLGTGMSNLPIPNAPKKEGVLHQARRALSKKKKPGIRAQPEKSK